MASLGGAVIQAGGGGGGATTNGCSAALVGCMGNNPSPASLSNCLITLTEQNCPQQNNGAGGGGGGGGQSPSQMMQQAFGNLGSFSSFGAMQREMRPKTINDLKRNNSSQMMDPTAINSPRGPLTVLPERDHYSPCTTGPGPCRASRNHTPYDYWAPYSGNATDAVRCNGKIDKLIRTDVLDPRYDEFNCHVMHRITYNRWCRADPGCCIGCHCAPKPCHCLIPCFTTDCWGKTISSDTPPCSTRWDHPHDLGFHLSASVCPSWSATYGTATGNLPTQRSYCYHPGVKGALVNWRNRGADINIDCPEKAFADVCNEVSACYPTANKGGMEFGGDVDARGEIAPEGAFLPVYSGLAKPAPCMDSTGYEYKQTGPRVRHNDHEPQMMVFNMHGRGVEGRNDGLRQVADARVDFPPVVDFGFNDGDLGLAKKVLAQAAGPRTPGQCAYGGTNGATGGALGNKGFTPDNAIMETVLSQARTAREFGHNCLPDYHRTYAMMDPQTFFSASLAGTHQNAVRKSDLPFAPQDNSGGGGNYEDIVLQSVSMNLSCKGWPDAPDAPERFPQAGGGVVMATHNDAFGTLADEGSNAAGAFLLLHENPQAGQRGGIPNLAAVVYASRTADNRPFMEVRITNYGFAPTNCGTTTHAGVPQTFLVFQNEGDIPRETMDEYRRANITDFECKTGRLHLGKGCTLQQPRFVRPYANPQAELNIIAGNGRIGAGTTLAGGWE